MTFLCTIHRFLKQKPYKTSTPLLWAKQKGTFFTNKKESGPYKTSLCLGRGKRSKGENGKLLRNVNNTWNLNGCPVMTNPMVHYEVWHILLWIILSDSVDHWRI